jgi:hypothetical protein
MSCMDGRRGPVDRLELRGYVGLGSKRVTCSFKSQLSSQVNLPSLCITADTFALLIVILVLLTSY